ncbi:SMP-30/gluconolactonase/LRE family protein [Leptospira sp. GIMC2001]|uniref:SMP-30/gluconolactonase/LRE family protein n=1 Tax=Leptospira sp. GIMC2001 TaxID=1513297 RepID=UPI0023496AB7|nr:SMP-30/gluconolactonase/LRE family protein [Leptospira sp. GIMC2001]WCL49611.1 SMP-30/gluconolactonase/LRE family protein [Leptospira sp. GIMC2001]
MKFSIYSTIIILIALLTGCNSENIKIGKSHSLDETPKSIIDVKTLEDPINLTLDIIMPELPGHDDIIFDNTKNVAYASGMDGWIWKLDFKLDKASQWAKPPVNPAGMQFSDNRKNSILVCASRLGGEEYKETDRVGLYEFDIATKKFKPLVLDLPRTDREDFEIVYPKENRIRISVNDLNPENSRPFSLCNDLAVSRDGKRIYITEPFERENASMGSGAVPEAIGLYPHGKLWMYNRSDNTVSLVLNGFTFVDGILIEEDSSEIEESVLFTETTKFRIIRSFISGKRQGESEIILENLPGLADGMERDDKGRIWIGIIKRRSGVINFLHNNPWLKSFVLSLPQKMLPISKQTGILVLDKNAKNPIYYSMHDGSKITDISVAIPNNKRIYLPSFNKESKGLFSIPNPLGN